MLLKTLGHVCHRFQGGEVPEIEKLDRILRLLVMVLAFGNLLNLGLLRRCSGHELRLLSHCVVLNPCILKFESGNGL